MTWNIHTNPSEACIYSFVRSSKKFPFSLSSHRTKSFNRTRYAWREDLLRTHVASTSANLNVCVFSVFHFSLNWVCTNEWKKLCAFFIPFLLGIWVCLKHDKLVYILLLDCKRTKNCFICKFIELVVPSSVFCYVSHSHSTSILTFIQMFALFCPRNVIHF